jgi:mRNA interferase YafQ
MKKIRRSRRFKKEYKLSLKRGKDSAKLEVAIECLVNDRPLPERCSPHKLKGEYAGLWECHIEPDWLLIYDITETAVELFRTGTHSDLFD